MKYVLIFTLLFTFSCKSVNNNSSNEDYIPKNLVEAVAQLEIIHNDSTKKVIIEMTEKEYVGSTHFGTGMWIRNNWGLWNGDDLAEYFNSIGIYHPDDMSGIILKSYYRELHKQVWKLEEQVQYYQDYWNKSNNKPTGIEIDTLR